MLFLTLFTSLAVLKGSIISPTSLCGSAEADNIWTRDTVTDEDNLRTTYDIAWSCLVTIFACVWSSAHPNIPGPRDAGWTRLKRRAVTMLCALIVPELMAFWAMKQHAAADAIAKDYNEEIAKASPQTQSFWAELKEWFAELPETEAQRSSSQPWSKTHGFFVQMGGFILYENGCAKKVLDYDDLKKHILEDEIDAPTVTVSEIKDRSKGDAISKGFVVLQTTWFVVQCITRLCGHLPLSELEVVTLAFALLNWVIYAVWWNKPQGVGVAVCIPLKQRKDVQLQRGEPSDREPGSTGYDHGGHEESAEMEETTVDDDRYSLDIERQAIKDTSGLPPGEKKTIKGGLLRRRLAEDWSTHRLVVFVIIRIPYRCGQSLLGPISKIGTDFNVPVGALRVPMFYADRRGNSDSTMTPFYVSVIIGTVFGAVHCLAWSSDSLAHAWTALLLWRVSTLVIIMDPILLQMVRIIGTSNFKDTQPGRALFWVVVYSFFFSIPLYIMARFALVILAFLSLHALQPSIFVTIPWTSFIPHL